MKRQWNLADFFSKKTRLEQVVSELALDDTKLSQAKSPQLGENSKSNEIDSSNIENTLPECWTVLQYNYFKEKYDGLVVSNKKLGCEYCSKHDFAKAKGVHVSKEWKHFQIMAAGTNKEVQQSSLRKKMKEHFSSKAHTICKENTKQGKQDAITKALDNVTEKYLSTTCRVFNTVYSLAQRCRPFSDIEDEIALQIKNGLDMGIELHSHKTAVKIVDFIAKEIKKEIFTKIIEKNLKICLIIDEALMMSCKPVVMLFVKVEGSFISPIIFVELVELEKQDAETIFSSVMESLNSVGFTRKYMGKNLTGFCSDGASVMLGRKSGVSTRITKEFPNIIIWHYLNNCQAFVENVLQDSNRCVIPDSIQKAKNIARTIAISSAEAERSFSKMSFICSETKNHLTVSNIANIMTVSLIGLPLKDWDPIPTVKKWLRAHHTADDA